MSGTLLDRIYADLLESGRAWTAAEVGQVHLKLAAAGPAPERLVRGLLSGDARFVERPPGAWNARARALPSLATGTYLLAWVETGDAPDPARWRLHLSAHESARREVPGLLPDAGWILLPEDPEPWVSLRRRGAGCRLATCQPGLLQRLLQWMEARWVLEEWSPPPLDLLAWSRVALVREGVGAADSLKEARLPNLAVRWRLGPLHQDSSGAAPATLGAALDHLLERFGSWTEENLAEAWKECFQPRAVPWDRFAFDPADVEAIPDGSGTYRFFNSEGSLLYVGKAVRLGRRVGSYFRPLPPEPSRREQLLGQIRRFEISPAPSELEALVLEARAIRRENPPWNVQVETHRPERFPADWWWPLVFVAPGADLLRVSAFLVEGPDRAHLIHLPREGEPAEFAPLAAWLESVLEKGENVEEDPETDPEAGFGAGPEDDRDAGDGSGHHSGHHSGDEPSLESDPAGDAPSGFPVTLLDPSEAWIVLRFYLRERERLHRVDSHHFTSGPALLDALFALVRTGNPDGAPLDQRPPRLSP